MIVCYYHKGPFGRDNVGNFYIPNDELLNCKSSSERIALIDRAVENCRVHCSLVWEHKQLHEWEIDTLHPNNTIEQDVALVEAGLNDVFSHSYIVKAAEAALKRLAKRAKTTAQ